MKLSLFAISLASAYALAYPLSAALAHDDHDHAHVHDHEAHDHDHEGHDHDHEAHDHDHEGHDHDHEGHDHDHEGHDHDHEGHDHDHEGHDHDHEGHDHDHEGHDHDHEAHDHDHEGHDHDHEAHDHDHEAHDHDHEAHDHDHEGHDHDSHGGGCSGDHDHSHEADEPVVVTVDAHARDIMNMKVEAVPEAGRALVGSVYGYLAAPEHAVETYALPCEGRIVLHVKSAQTVKKGELLYSLQSPAISAALADSRKADAALSRCGTEVKALQERVGKLQAIGSRNSELESQLTFKEAEAVQLRHESDAATALLRQLTHQGKLREEAGVLMLDVYADKRGTVRNVGVSQGSWGGQGAPVVTMSNPDMLEVSTSLYASAVPTFSEISATLNTGASLEALQGTWRLDEQVDPEKQTRALYFTPESLPETARAGQLCRLDLYSDASGTDVVSIPDSAIIKVGVDDVVFLEVEEGRYAMVKVHAGESRRGMTPVRGLVPGQRLVVHGGYELKYILPTQGEKKKAGHFHADGKFHEGED